MTKKQIQTLDDYYSSKIPKDKFLQEFGKDIEDADFIKRELHKAIESKEEESIDRAINLLWVYEDYGQFVDELNILLLEPKHRRHQVITKTIQDLKNPKSVPFIKKALESNFDYLEYTCSESSAIAKWFSWALFSIGTNEAIDLIEEYTKSDEEGIRNEMIYRLDKVKR